VIGMQVGLERFDLSLATRRATKNGIVHEAAAAMKRAGFGLKAATITPETQRRRRLAQRDPAARDRRQGDRAHRPPLPGIRPIAGIHSPISIVRMAVGDAYGATEWRERNGR
jgi:isocitrate dehydrogenase (NAD+)